MALGYDIGASASLSSGATSGNIGALQISGGNTGSNTPSWVTLAIVGLVFVAVVIWLKNRRHK